MKDLEIWNLRIIDWFLQIYLSNQSTQSNQSNLLKLIHLNYLTKKRSGLFDVFSRPTRSKSIDLVFDGIVVNTTLAQARCICWFLSNPVILEKLINAYKLFLLPKSF